MTILHEIENLFTRHGSAAYFGENVSQEEHALQAAHLAERAGAGHELVIAALLHDVGHLLHGLPETIAEDGIDGHHEAGGAAWLAQHFGPAVSEPVRLHVAAKRYLCAVDPVYAKALSAASRLSLELQGGTFRGEQARAFELHPHFRAAVALRHWDDAAKVPGLSVPGLEHYRERIATIAQGAKAQAANP
jgi:[1-hydroxy-2-(trimethylamino)ethyl]phosphonate dioxygenase